MACATTTDCKCSAKAIVSKYSWGIVVICYRFPCSSQSECQGRSAQPHWNRIQCIVWHCVWVKVVSLLRTCLLKHTSITFLDLFQCGASVASVESTHHYVFCSNRGTAKHINKSNSISVIPIHRGWRLEMSVSSMYLFLVKSMWTQLSWFIVEMDGVTFAELVLILLFLCCTLLPN